MIVLSNSACQTVNPGQAVNFDSVLLHTGNAEFHRKGSPAIKLRCRGIYEVNFSGNIASTEKSPIQLSVAVDGNALPESTMISSPQTTNMPNNISTSFPLQNCCACTPITIVNDGELPLILEANSVFYVARRA